MMGKCAVGLLSILIASCCANFALGAAQFTHRQVSDDVEVMIDLFNQKKFDEHFKAYDAAAAISIRGGSEMKKFTPSEALEGVQKLTEDYDLDITLVKLGRFGFTYIEKLAFDLVVFGNSAYKECSFSHKLFLTVDLNTDRNNIVKMDIFSNNTVSDLFTLFKCEHKKKTKKMKKKVSKAATTDVKSTSEKQLKVIETSRSIRSTISEFYEEQTKYVTKDKLLSYFEPDAYMGVGTGEQSKPKHYFFANSNVVRTNAWMEIDMVVGDNWIMEHLMQLVVLGSHGSCGGGFEIYRLLEFNTKDKVISSLIYSIDDTYIASKMSKCAESFMNSQISSDNSSEKDEL